MIRLVVEDASEIKVRVKQGDDRGLTDCVQPIFELTLLNVGDPLFNGPWGYRAQYRIGAWHGLAANSALLAALAPRLLGAMDANAEPRLLRIDVCASLLAASAKIWIRDWDSLDQAAGLAVETVG